MLLFVIGKTTTCDESIFCEVRTRVQKGISVFAGLKREKKHRRCPGNSEISDHSPLVTLRERANKQRQTGGKTM